MRLLLSANFFRLWRSRAFWGSVIAMAAVAVFELTAGCLSARSMGIDLSLENRYMIFALVSGVVLSAFCSLFVGAEHSDGALRNKISVGHSRASIYLADLFTCGAAGVLVCLGYIVPMLAAGIPLMGFFSLGLWPILRFTVFVFVMNAALCALFTLIAMLNENKASSAIACIFLAYFLLFLGIYLNSRLTEPEMMPAREYIQDGEILLQDAYPNPAYVQGVKRAVYELLYALPGCQAVQLTATAEACPWRLPLASLLAAAIATGIGLALFRRKDLK